MTLKSYANSEEKLTCDLKKDLRNLTNFRQSASRCQNWDFDGILLSKIEKELRVKTMKNNVKFEEELTRHFKTGMSNLTNYDSSTQKSKTIAL